jgi:hypothetical protein
MRLASLVGVLLAVAMPLTADAACECYGVTGPQTGYLNLTPVPCWYSYDPGDSRTWIKARNQQTSAQIYLIVPSAWQWNGCNFVDYVFRQSDGLPRISSFYTSFPGCESMPSTVQPDGRAPDSVRTNTWCGNAIYTKDVTHSSSSCSWLYTTGEGFHRAIAEEHCAGVTGSEAICNFSLVNTSGCYINASGSPEMTKRSTFSCQESHQYNLCQ